MQNLARTYYHLIRFLITPTRFLSVIFVLSVVLVIIMPILVWLGMPHWLFAFSVIAAMILGILMLNIQPQLAMLSSRKSFVLCGNAAFHITVLTAGLLVFSAALIMLAIVNMPSDNNPIPGLLPYIRAVVLWSSGFLLLTYMGSLIGFNIAFILFIFLGFTGFNNSFDDLALWVANGSLGIWALAILAVVSWWHLYQKIRCGTLKRPFHAWENQGKFWQASSDRGLLEQSGLFNLLPRSALKKSGGNNGVVLLLESDYIVRDYALIFSILTFPIVAIVYAGMHFFGFFAAASVYTVMALALSFIPFMVLLGSVGTVSANIRRLWLLVPGGRCQHLALMERQFAILLAMVCVGFHLPATVLLWMDNQQLWWSLGWLVFVPQLMAMLMYCLLLTLWSDNPWMPLYRLIFSLFIVFTMLVFWFGRSLFISLGLLACFSILITILRPHAYQRWRKMNLSRLKLMSMGL